jgi:hypothetical protein
MGKNRKQLLGKTGMGGAFILSGEMAFAYFLNHWPERFWGSFAEPNQEAAILNSFLFLFLWGAGPGAWSLDGMWRPAARAQPAGYRHDGNIGNQFRLHRSLERNDILKGHDR